jgi:hypothetical protein
VSGRPDAGVLFFVPVVDPHPNNHPNIRRLSGRFESHPVGLPEQRSSSRQLRATAGDDLRLSALMSPPFRSLRSGPPFRFQPVAAVLEPGVDRARTRVRLGHGLPRASAHGMNEVVSFMGWPSARYRRRRTSTLRSRLKPGRSAISWWGPCGPTSMTSTSGARTWRRWRSSAQDPRSPPSRLRLLAS